MNPRQIKVASVVPSRERIVTIERSANSIGCAADGREVLVNINRQGWTIATDVDDTALIADAARGLWYLTRRGEE
mgnify:CR=1 FL=1